MLSLEKLRRRRVIDILRVKFPDLKWWWDQTDLSWCNSESWQVRRYAESAPQYDGDDDSFRTTYRRSDTNELVSLW